MPQQAFRAKFVIVAIYKDRDTCLEWFLVIGSKRNTEKVLEEEIVLTSAIHQSGLFSHHKQMYQTYVLFISYIPTVYQCVVRDEVIMEGVGQHWKCWLILVSHFRTWLGACLIGSHCAGVDLLGMSLDSLTCCELYAPAKFKGEE